MNKRRGYFDIELNGQSYTGHFSLNFWAELEDLRGYSSLEETLYEMRKGFNVSKIRDIIFCAIKANSMEQGEKVPFLNSAQVAMHMDGLDSDVLTQVIETLMESQLFKDESDSEDKKKEK